MKCDKNVPLGFLLALDLLSLIFGQEIVICVYLVQNQDFGRRN